MKLIFILFLTSCTFGKEQKRSLPQYRLYISNYGTFFCNTLDYAGHELRDCEGPMKVGRIVNATNIMVIE